MKSPPIALLAALVWPMIAQAGEPGGCDKFKWPIAHEQSALSAPPAARLEDGAALAFEVAAQLHLALFDDAKFDMPPGRAPKLSPSYAGKVRLDAPAAAGTYKITLSDEGWIDVIQDGRFVKPSGFSGAGDCPGVRKSVKFPLAAQPATIQLSNVKASTISLIVSPE